MKIHRPLDTPTPQLARIEQNIQKILQLRANIFFYLIVNFLNNNVEIRVMLWEKR